MANDERVPPDGLDPAVARKRDELLERARGEVAAGQGKSDAGGGIQDGQGFADAAGGSGNEDRTRLFHGICALPVGCPMAPKPVVG